MKLIKGQKVIITFKVSWFKDTGKIGTFVGVYQNRTYVYIEGSTNNHGQTTPDGDKYTWTMGWKYLKVLGQVQLLFPFMDEV